MTKDITKQEEIREGIIQGVNRILLHNPFRPQGKYREWLENEVDTEVINPLHSKDVVIKVERELPMPELGNKTRSFNYTGGFKYYPLWGYKAKLKRAGFVAVEPLIEDGK